MRELLSKYNKNYKTILAILKKKNLTYSKRNEKFSNLSLNRDKELSLIKDYENNCTLAELANKYSIGRRKIIDILKHNNIMIRAGCPIIKKVDETVFDDPLTEDAKYWIGFLMGDGNVSSTNSKRNARISLFLQSGDIDHIKKFIKFLKSDLTILDHTKKIGTKCYYSSGVVFTSKKIASQLEKFGVVPKKSLTAEVIHLEKDKDFWRGIVDADGSVFYRNKKYPEISLCGSKSIIEQFYKFTKNIADFKSSPVKNNSIFALKIHGKHAIKVIKKLYENCSTALDRKYKTAKTIIEKYEKLNFMDLVVSSQEN